MFRLCLVLYSNEKCTWCHSACSAEHFILSHLVLAGPPTSVIASSTTCGSNGNQVNLQWTPPTNTGGQGVMITHYNITGLPQSASCSAGPCDMVNGTGTTITGLQCNTSYSVSVRAVNCRGIGTNSDPINIIFRPPTPTPSKWNW